MAVRWASHTSWSWIQDARNGLRAALAVDDEGTPVGLVHYHPEPRTFDATVGVVVDDLYVTEEHRRNGVAHRLLDLVRGHAAELHATRLTWTNDPDDADGLALSDDVARRSPAITFEQDL